VQESLQNVRSFHEPDLREEPAGYYYDVIVNGYQTMYSYGSRIHYPEDRWAVVAYIRALQLSQNATLTDLPSEVQDEFNQDVSGDSSVDAEATADAASETDMSAEAMAEATAEATAEGEND
jgi:hypothetical protein